MRKFLLFFMVLVLIATAHGKKIAQLVELSRPQLMEVENDKLFVTEGVDIYIYSLKNFSLLKKFGKAGEGPREFKINPFGPGQLLIAAYDNKLYVNSDVKLSYFTLEGEFIKEIKVPPFQVFFPIKDKFVASGTAAGQGNQFFVNVGLYDADRKMLKELYRSDMSVGPSATFNFPTAIFSYLPYKDRIYVAAGKEGFVIDVFDLQGKRLYRIEKEYKPLKVPENYREQILQWYQKSSRFKQFFEFFKDRIFFDSHFPALQSMIVENEKIYVLTYRQKDGLTELIIMDLKGKELGRKYVPVVGMAGNLFEFPIHTIDTGNYYTLIENEEEEIWELHRVNLDI
jgi:hypothetical protein